MKIGDKVKFRDCSYMVRVDKFEENDWNHNTTDIFEIVAFPKYPELTSWSNKRVHDVFIKNVSTGAIYLHSLQFCRLVNIKEIFIGDAECKLAEYLHCDAVEIIY